MRDFRLAEWLVRPESCELIGLEAARQLRPRTSEVLLHLARHAGGVRSREEILAAVWGDAFVEEDVLSHCIWELRRALGDDSRKPRFIRTVHRKGYQLIAPVSWLENEPSIGGRYRLGERIGGGSMGTVHAAEDLRLKRDVALKFLPPELSREPEAKKRFLREARVAAGLDHPNLCTLYEVDETKDGQLFLVMPRYEGETLKQRIGRSALPWPEAMGVARQLAQGLAAAHSAGVVHRDVKPSNVFLTTDGRAKLLDFGVATLEDATDYSHPSSSPGTPAYMSPEQTQGERTGPRTDLWSLGVVLFECLTGCRPFTGENHSAVIHAIQHSEPQPLEERCSGVPESFTRLVEALLSKDSLGRPADAAAVLAVLDGSPAAELTADARTARLPSGEHGLMLLSRRVERFWIEQALTQSLGGAPPYQLALEPQPDAVDHPWGKLRPPDEEDLGSLPPDEPLTTTLRRFGGTLLILGEAGAGKTVSLLRLAQQAIECNRQDPSQPVPVVLQLASWADRAAPLEIWLEEEISRRYYVPRATARDWIRDGGLLLLLDGLDEVEAAWRGRCVGAINRFHESMPLVPLAVTCRTEDYRNLARRSVRLALGGGLAVQALSPVQVATALAGTPDVRRRVEQDSALRELVRSPLILAILRRIGLEDPARSRDSIESDRGRLLFRYVRSCLRSRSSTYPPYPEHRTVQWLARLAKSMLGHNRTLFQLEEIQPSWLVAIWRRWAYVLLSRIGICLSVAAAFALQVWVAQGPDLLPLILTSSVVAGVVVAALDLFLLARAGKATTIGAWAYALLVAAVAVIPMIGAQRLVLPERVPIGPVLYTACLAGILRRRLDDVRWSRDVAAVESLRWSWRGAGQGLVSATLVVWLLTTIVGVARGALNVPADVLSTLPNGLIGGLIAAILIGLRPGLLDVETRTNHGIWLSARNAALGAGLLFIGTFLAFWLGHLLALTDLLGPTHIADELGFRQLPSMVWSMSIGLASLGAIGLGGVELIKHFVLRGLLWTEGTAPIRYSRFLAYVARCAILRSAGDGYVFAHRSLQEYLASLGSDAGTESG